MSSARAILGILALLLACAACKESGRNEPDQNGLAGGFLESLLAEEKQRIEDLPELPGEGDTVLAGFLLLPDPEMFELAQDFVTTPPLRFLPEGSEADAMMLETRALPESEIRAIRIEPVRVSSGQHEIVVENDKLSFRHIFSIDTQVDEIAPTLLDLSKLYEVHVKSPHPWSATLSWRPAHEGGYFHGYIHPEVEGADYYFLTSVSPIEILVDKGRLQTLDLTHGVNRVSQRNEEDPTR